MGGTIDAEIELSPRLRFGGDVVNGDVDLGDLQAGQVLDPFGYGVADRLGDGWDAFPVLGDQVEVNGGAAGAGWLAVSMSATWERTWWTPGTWRAARLAIWPTTQRATRVVPRELVRRLSQAAATNRRTWLMTAVTSPGGGVTCSWVNSPMGAHNRSSSGRSAEQWGQVAWWSVR